MLIELIRQARRRRTGVAALAIAALPVVIVVALYVNGGPATGGGRVDLVDLATHSGVFAAFFVLAATSQFLLVVIVALFAGDSVASEAQWGTLRYLLVRPVARMRLLRVKLSVAALFGVAAAVGIPVVGLAAGTLAFGWKGVLTPLGMELPPGQGLLRLAACALYVIAMMGCVVGLAFLFSTLTDAPLAAVGSAVVLIVISEVLDSVTALGGVRNVLPTHYWFDWTELLNSPARTTHVAQGLLSALPWTVVPLLLAFARFRRKDILS